MRAHYLSALEAVRHNLVEMGETTLLLLTEALQALTDPNPGRSARASELEAQTDHQHRLIHDQCLNLITLQSPVARDARLLTGTLEAIVDLELIGDYAYEISVQVSSLQGRPPSQILNQISEIGARIRTILAAAVESWRTGEREQALVARPQGVALRAECGTAMEKISQLMSAPGMGMTYVNLLMVCGHLERILRHAVCLAEQAAASAPVASTVN